MKDGIEKKIIVDTYNAVDPAADHRTPPPDTTTIAAPGRTVSVGL
jgi:hypothetical protein